MFSFAGTAVKSILGSKVKNAIGNDESKPDAPDTAGGVNWTEFNYPPCIQVMHFDPEKDAIPVLAKTTIRRMKYLWYYSTGILIFNLCSNIGFVADSTDSSIVIFYSFMQIITGLVLGGLALYQGYRGVAGDLAQSSRIYLVCQTCLTIIMIIFLSIQSGNVHGFEGITSRADSATQPAYLVLCILESTAWVICVAFSGFCMYSVYKYPGHERALRLESLATSKDEKHGRPRKNKGGGEKGANGGDEEEQTEMSASKKAKGGKKGKGKKAQQQADEEV